MQPQGKFKLSDIEEPSTTTRGRYSSSDITYQSLGDDPLSTISKEAKKFGLQLGSTKRTPTHNAEVGGAKNSFHLYGLAADIKGDSSRFQEFHDYMKNIYGTNLAELLNEGDHVHIAWNQKQSQQDYSKDYSKSLQEGIAALNPLTAGIPLSNISNRNSVKRGKELVKPSTSIEEYKPSEYEQGLVQQFEQYKQQGNIEAANLAGLRLKEKGWEFGSTVDDNGKDWPYIKPPSFTSNNKYTEGSGTEAYVSVLINQRELKKQQDDFAKNYNRGILRRVGEGASRGARETLDYIGAGGGRLLKDIGNKASDINRTLTRTTLSKDEIDKRTKEEVPAITSDGNIGSEIEQYYKNRAEEAQKAQALRGQDTASKIAHEFGSIAPYLIPGGGQTTFAVESALGSYGQGSSLDKAILTGVMTAAGAKGAGKLANEAESLAVSKGLAAAARSPESGLSDVVKRYIARVGGQSIGLPLIQAGRGEGVPTNPKEIAHTIALAMGFGFHKGGVERVDKIIDDPSTNPEVKAELENIKENPSQVGYRLPNESAESYHERLKGFVAPERLPSLEDVRAGIEKANKESIGIEPGEILDKKPIPEDDFKGSKVEIPKQELLDKGFPVLDTSSKTNKIEIGDKVNIKGDNKTYIVRDTKPPLLLEDAQGNTTMAPPAKVSKITLEAKPSEAVTKPPGEAEAKPTLSKPAIASPEALQEQPTIGEPSINDAPGDEPKSVGAAAPGQFSKEPEIEQLRKIIEQKASEFDPTKEDFSKRENIAEKYDDLKASAIDKLTKLKDSATKGWSSFKAGVKPENDFVDLVHKWQAEKQLNAGNSQLFAKDVREFIPSKLVRSGIRRWIDVGGDVAALQEGALRSPYKRSRRIYKAALNLKPEEIEIAKQSQSYFDSMLQKAIDEGMLKEGIDNYINRTYKPSTAKALIAKLSDIQSEKLPVDFQHVRHRFYKTLLDAEMAGKKSRTDDIADLIPIYNTEFGDTLAAREFVKNSQEGLAKDKRPILAMAGSANENQYGGVFVNPETKTYTVRPDPYNRLYDYDVDVKDYVPYDHPAFKNQTKRVYDTKDGYVNVKGDVLVHPDFIKEFKNRFDKGFAETWTVSPFDVEMKPAKIALAAKAQIKAAMMVGGFHEAHIDVRALKRRVWNPYKGFSMKNLLTPGKSQEPLNPNLPEVKAAIEDGVKIYDSHGAKLFAEGTGSAEWVHHIPGIGPKLKAYTDWLFTNHIARIKVMFYTDAVKRNLEKYDSQIKAGKITETQVRRLTATQTNASFGELNYDVLGTSKTTQDLMRLFILAPDFTRAQLQTSMQFLQKYNREQRIALIGGAMGMYVLARAFNAALNNGEMYADDYDKAFKVHVKIGADEHWISLRAEPQDFVHLTEAPGQFITNRLSPEVQMARSALWGTDRFGNKIDPDTKRNRAIETAKTPTPMFIHQDLETSIMQFFGITVSKYNPNEKAFKRKEDITEKTMDRTGLKRKVVEKELQKWIPKSH